MLCFCLIIPAIFCLSACTQTEDPEKPEDPVDTSITITYDYGAAKIWFDNNVEFSKINKGENLTNLPTIKSQYATSFKGWFVAGTTNDITLFDYITDDLTVEARFDLTQATPAGLYRNGKCVKLWSSIRSDYPNAFDYNSIISPSSGPSYFEYLSGDLVIGSEITSIGSDAFYYAKRITTIVIPNSVTSIGDHAFNYCTSLTKINIPSSITSIEWATFSTTGLESITIPNSVTSIGKYAFDSCEKLTNITIPSSVTSIGIRAFAVCTSLESITIPNSVTEIGHSAFYYCTALKNITIPSNITEIDVSTFRYCENLKEVIIESETMANSLTNKYSGEYLIYYADTIYIKNSLSTSGSTYLIENFTKQATSDKVGYDKWVKNN